MDPGCAWLPSLGSLTPAEKDRRDRVVPDRASAVVKKIHKLGPALAPRVGWEPSGFFGAQCKSTPTANAAGRKQRVGATGDARQGK